MNMGFCYIVEQQHHTRMAEQRVRRAAQKAQAMSRTAVPQSQHDVDAQQRRQVQYLCDQVQLAVAERKPRHIIDALLDDLSTVSGRPRMAV